MTEQKIGWSALLSGSNGIRSLALAGGVALHAINVYIATTILPSVVAEIGGLDYYAWNTTLFIVASIIGSVLSANLLAVSGPRGAYVVAAGLFGLGTFICALAPSMPILLLGRFVQGLGGGLLFALAYAMIRLVFPQALWPRAMAVVSGMWGVATLAGPAIGGTFAELGSWRMAFWAVLPTTGLFAALAFAILPGRSPDTDEKPGLAVPQLALLILAVFVVSLGSVNPKLVWNIAGIAAALFLVAILVLIEGRAETRLLPRGAFRLSSPLCMLFVTISVLAIAVTVSEMFIPLFLQVLHAQTPLIAGYLSVLMSVGWTMGSIMSSSNQGRRAEKAVRLAPVVALSGMILLALLMPGGSQGEWLVLGPLSAAFILVGAGVGISWPHLLTRILQAAPPGEQDLASASITTVQLFATALGSALAGMVVNLAGLTDPGGHAGTQNAAFWLFAVFAIAPLIGVFSAARALGKDERR
ncbi:MFS transporter [Nordella sp. HKS 07]|uniref:MFS transporter n=1 Tax=Nordella sp. HKS 07 TaxID=2712222 RepID=UPI0013E11CF4|nr:MFS transporter [Nordella sp. HKS 07]QIG51648.1 MFS transporter [Nordella sp. HKS 07]